MNCGITAQVSPVDTLSMVLCMALWCLPRTLLILLSKVNFFRSSITSLDSNAFVKPVD